MASDRTKSILVSLLKAGGIITFTVLAPGASVLLEGFTRNKKIDKREFSRTLKRLENNKLVSVSNKNGQMTVGLRAIGRQKAIEYELDGMVIPTPKKWDKKWRVVIFDIPEKKRSARYYLKDKLDNLGFIQLQKSTYIYPFSCEDQIRCICSVYGVSKYVKFIVADQIDGQDHLESIYNLVPK
jgi:DNA-binding transcriptional regulator PaaX